MTNNQGFIEELRCLSGALEKHIYELVSYADRLDDFISFLAESEQIMNCDELD